MSARLVAFAARLARLLDLRRFGQLPTLPPPLAPGGDVTPGRDRYAEPDRPAPRTMSPEKRAELGRLTACARSCPTPDLCLRFGCRVLRVLSGKANGPDAPTATRPDGTGE